MFLYTDKRLLNNNKTNDHLCSVYLEMQSHSLWVGKIAPVNSLQTEDDNSWDVRIVEKSFENFLSLVA